ncbi:MAG: hypothetical protein LQ346_004795 [Caloplaca aetnensis]|nr:MAG: hypothetical protein LQ346_004795 [Caloplaca aetnensis]
MSAPSNRLLLRQARILGRRSGQRHASTTSQAADAASSTASKTKEKASDATSKASQGLSRVTSSAGPALSGAAQGVSNALGRIGGRTGRLISFVECESETTGNLQAFQAYTQPLIQAVRHPASLFNQATTSGSATPSSILTRVRDLNSRQLGSAGVVAAEVLGFFSVGEMIGRMKIVGYRGAEEHH